MDIIKAFMPKFNAWGSFSGIGFQPVKLKLSG